MTTILIEKYVEGACVEELRIPVGPLQFVAGLLPGSAFQELQRQGLNLDALLNETNPDRAVQWLDVEEKNVRKRIRISRQD